MNPFKNLQIYRLAHGWEMTPAALEDALRRHPLTPCTGLSLMTRGWVPPHESALAESYGKHLLIALGVEQKMLPASVVKQEADARAQELEQKLGYKPGKKQLRDLKERVTVELLPRAFAKRSVTRCWINPADGYVVVDASSAARAEDLLTMLRDTLDGFPATHMAMPTSAQGRMTAWAVTGFASEPFALGEDCRLTDPSESGRSVRYARHELNGKDVRDHIHAGKVVSKLGLVWRERLSFVLQEPLSVKRLKFLEVAKAEPSEGDQFEAGFALMVGELSALVGDLMAELGGAQ